ncbi:M4 family metallopeptidase [Nocardioides allogilvus]|uniref:M4 family metallopeptidase n=1 Tax=Nocardioides allogilvus TaxID=2072017 RepID=UPI000D30B13F|nr:M4 family metallopeptidase [Nocardioides allogilvus]
MKLLKQGVALAMLGAGLVAVPSLQAQATPAATSAAAADNGVQAMKNEADGLVAVSGESATKRVGFIRLTQKSGDLMPSRGASSKSAAAAKADAYLAKYAANFGARPGELTQEGVTSSASGWTVSYTQAYKGVPVFGSMLRAHVDKQGDLTSVNGYAAPDLSLSTTPRITAAGAAERAVGTVRANPPGHEGDADTTGIRAASTELAVYRLGSTKGEAGKAILAWIVEVSNDANVRDVLTLDAATGKLVNRYSLIHDGLYRELYEATYARKGLKWKEGDKFPGRLDVDQQNEVLATGESYWFFKNAFGRDSYDDAGHKMITVNNDPRISCPNANWNGVTTNYCSGVSSDDVVAHEWGHAYTEYTHGLIYQWQSGALNESYSDIWGETVDLINGRMDADEGDITAKRQVGVCSTHSPARPIVLINSPATIAKECEAGAASFGPQLDGAGVSGDVVLAVDNGQPLPDGTPSPSTSDACTALTNGAAVAGKVALVDRGSCAFTIKVKNAQAAGATAVLVADNVEATPSGMSGVDPAITIPAVRIRLSDGNLIKSELPNGPVNITMKDASGDRADTYRWLMGEDSSAFGGAIRDMWSPTCHGDPGKVSDAEYYCATDDGGGVHSNSGVPNHGYALLVDGGTYNGVTVKGLGLDKSAAIYFRAMVDYQTPTTDFADHADALAASCLDLVGQPIATLTTAANAKTAPADSIRRADCAQVGNMAAAVELRTDPVQCNFKPLLDPNTPALCGEGGTETQVWSEDFEDGLAGWTASQQVVFAGGFGQPWEASSTAPGDHAGGVAFGPAPDRGQCSNGAGDFSSRDSITSPSVSIPAAGAARLSFEHYVSTESGYDGGNVKVSINGGDFMVIPAAAYTFNKPSKIFDASTNTNPLAGEDGFTGTDGGEIGGSWGTSQVDLTQAGVKAGDTVTFRFDIGRDGCGGLEGWAVDNVEVATCPAPAATAAGTEGRRR